MEKLSVTQPDANVNDLKRISMAMQQFVKTESEESMTQVVETLNKNSSLWSRLFPTQIQKEQNRISVDRMRMLYKAKADFFELYTNIQLEIARKQGDALVASVGMDLQSKLTTYAAQKIDEITQTIKESRSNFLKQTKPQFIELEDYKDIPELYEPAYQSVRNEIAVYFESIDKLLRGFVQALESKVTDSRK